MDEHDELLMRCTAYLAMGGLFNPELADHDAVRDLIRDIRDYLSATTETQIIEAVKS